MDETPGNYYIIVDSEYARIIDDSNDSGNNTILEVIDITTGNEINTDSPIFEVYREMGESDGIRLIELELELENPILKNLKPLPPEPEPPEPYLFSLISTDQTVFEGDPNPQPSLENFVDDLILPEGVSDPTPTPLVPSTDGFILPEGVSGPTPTPWNLPTIFTDSVNFLP